jgi:hypothetical protein
VDPYARWFTEKPAMAYLFNFEFRLSWRDWRRFSIREALDRRDKTCPKISSTNFNNSLASAHGYFLCGKVIEYQLLIMRVVPVR